MVNWHLISKEEALSLTGSQPEGLSATESEGRLREAWPECTHQQKEKARMVTLLFGSLRI